jgi:hypothetical protein
LQGRSSPFFYLVPGNTDCLSDHRSGLGREIPVAMPAFRY